MPFLRWLIPVIATLVTIALGYCGFRDHHELQEQAASTSDILYRVLQLFFLESGAVTPTTPWQLDVARFLAPAVSAYAALLAVLTIFRDQLLKTRLIRCRDHVIICGLGDKGLHLAEKIQAAGRKVVVVESDPDNGNLAICRDRGMGVLVGNAADPGMLRRARVAQATHVFACCGEDELNADIAIAAERAIAARTTGALTCIAYIRDIRLCRHLREKELIDRLSSRFTVEYLNIDETGARMILADFPAFDEAHTESDDAPHVLIAGSGHMGATLVTRIVGDWRHARREGRIRITAMRDDARAWRASLLESYPRLERYCRLETSAASGRDAGPDPAPDFTQADLSHVSTAYVCSDDATDAASTAMVLHRHLRERGRRIPIIVPMLKDGGLTRLLPGPDDESGAFGNITSLSLYSRCLTADLLDTDTFVVIARAIHEEYRAHRAMAGHLDMTDPAMKPWPELGPKLRKSNIDQAVHISERLRAFGYDIVPLSDWEAEYHAFDDDDVAGMAEMEHERWVRDKTADGFTYAPGPKTDKTNPCLVPWTDLPEHEKDKDRQAVRAAPRVLARAGFQVVRVGDGCR